MKILSIGNFDPAGISIMLAKAINGYTEHTCRSIVVSDVSWGWEHDIIIDKVRDDFEEVRSLIEEADVLHFNNGDWDDMFFFGPIKWKDHIWGKKVVVYHIGDGSLNSSRRYNEKYRGMHVGVLASTPRIGKLHEGAVVIPCPFIPNDPVYKPSKRNCDGIVRVCHSPTDQLSKNTDLFRSVMNKIRGQYGNVEEVLITGKAHAECLQTKRMCDISFDLIYHQGFFGMSGLESMSLGIPTLAYVSESELAGYKEILECDDLPIVNVTPDTLYDEILELVCDDEKRQRIGQASRKWVEKYWCEQKCARRFIEFYETLRLLKK